MRERLAKFSADEIAAARAGRTWPMLFLKQALATLPVAEAHRQFSEAMLRPGSGLVLKELVGIQDYSRRNSTIFKELERGGDSFVNRPGRVIGESDHRLLSAHKRCLYVTVLDAVATRGRSQLIELPGKVLLDFENDELHRIDDDVELDSAVFRRHDNSVWIIDEPATDPLCVDECFSLLGPNSFAFGHWIVDFLPRLWVAMESGLMPSIPILIDQGMSRQNRQSLEMIVPTGTQIIEVEPMQRVEIGKLWYAPAFFYTPIYPRFNERFRYDFVASPPDRFRDIFHGMYARMAPMIGPSVGNEKIYLARKPGSRRKLINHEAIEEIAGQAGFRRVYLEDIDFIEQLRLMAKAKYLIGPEGSAFFMAFFARPGTRACILNHRHTEYLTTVTALLDAMQVDCTVLTGPFRRVDPEDYLHHSDYEIDTEVFSDFLRSWCRE